MLATLIHRTAKCFQALAVLVTLFTAQISIAQDVGVRPTGKPVLPFLNTEYPIQLITDIEWSPDGDTLYVASLDGGIYCYSVVLDNGIIQTTFLRVLRWPLSHSQGKIFDICVGPDGHVFAAGESTFGARQNQIVEFDPSSGAYAEDAFYTVLNDAAPTVDPKVTFRILRMEIVNRNLIAVDESGSIWSFDLKQAPRVATKLAEFATEVSSSEAGASLCGMSVRDKTRVLITFTPSSKSRTEVKVVSAKGTLLVQDFVAIPQRVVDPVWYSPTRFACVMPNAKDQMVLATIDLASGKTAEAALQATALHRLSDNNEVLCLQSELRRDFCYRIPLNSLKDTVRAMTAADELEHYRDKTSLNVQLAPNLIRVAPGGKVAAVTSLKAFYLVNLESESFSDSNRNHSTVFAAPIAEVTSVSARQSPTNASLVVTADGALWDVSLQDSDRSEFRRVERDAPIMQHSRRLTPWDEASSFTVTSVSNRLNRWKISGPETKAEFVLLRQFSVVRGWSLTFGNERLLIAATENGGLHFFQENAQKVLDWQYVGSLHGHRAEVLDADFLEDQRILVTVGNDRLVHFWNLKGGVLDRDLDLNSKWGVEFKELDGRSVLGKVHPQSSLAAAGWKQGDTITQIWGQSHRNERLSGKNVSPFLGTAMPDETFYLWTTPGNAANVLNQLIRPAFVPLFSMVFRRDTGDWAAWMPDGRFDASIQGGNKLFGWQFWSDVPGFAVTQPDFRTGAELYDRFKTPDLIQKALTGQIGGNNDPGVAATLSNTNAQMPVVRIIAPEDDVVQQQRVAKITAICELRAGKKLDDFNLVAQCNGRPMGRPLTTNIPSGIKLEWDLGQLDKRNEVRVRLVDKTRDDSGLFAEDSTVFGALTGGGSKYRPKVHLMVLAAASYDQNRWSEATAFKRVKTLKYCLNDADLVENLFSGLHQGASPALELVKPVIRVEEARLSVAGVQDAIAKMKARFIETPPDPRDLFVLFVASHGAGDEGWFYIVPPMPENGGVNVSGLTQIKQAEKTMIPWSLFHEWLEAGLPCRCLILLDACHSGAVPSFPARTQEKYGAFLLLAAGPKEFAEEDDATKHGIFTWSFAKAATDRSSRPRTIRDVASYVTIDVATRAKELNHQQTPVFKDDSVSAAELLLFEDVSRNP